MTRSPVSHVDAPVFNLFKQPIRFVDIFLFMRIPAALLQTFDASVQYLGIAFLIKICVNINCLTFPINYYAKFDASF